MKEKFIILRSVGGGWSPLRGNVRTFGGGPLGQPPVSSVAVDVEEMEPDEAAGLSRHRDVECVAPDMQLKLIAPLEVPGAPQPAAGTAAWGVKAVGADTSAFTGAGITVAVLDTGIDANHRAFTGMDIVEKDFTGEGNGDRDGHGTHCAGTLFGRVTDGVRIGVALGVKRALIGKIVGKNGASSENMAKGMEWAAYEGAEVVSISVGLDFPAYVTRMQKEEGFPVELATARALESFRSNILLFERLSLYLQAVAGSRTTVVIAAAGNESRMDVDPKFAIPVSPPAVAEGIVSVAALGQGQGGLGIAPFSNIGADISGPGVGILSAAAGGGLRTLSGTSTATPHVAGVAALWAEKLAQSGRLTFQNLSAQLIVSGTTKSFRSGFKPSYVGAGLVSAPEN